MNRLLGAFFRARKRVISVAIASLALVSLIVAGWAVSTQHAEASGAVQIAPVVAEVSDGLASGVTTYSVFSDTTTNYTYTGGPVTLSTCSDGSCTIVVDDALKLTVTRPNGTVWTNEWDFYTHDQSAADVTAAFQIGTNVVRAQLIDLVGPLEGSPRPFYLVSTAAPAPSITVSVTTGAHFISNDPSDTASLPLHVHVARSNGSPVSGAQITLSNTAVSLTGASTVTDSQGNVTASVTLPPGPGAGNDPVTGDVSSTVIASVNGQGYSSATTVLYHGEELDNAAISLTADEASEYSLITMGQNALQPDLVNLLLSTCAGDIDPGNPFCDAGIVAETIFSLVSGGDAYNPQAGDQISAETYEYTSNGVTPVYLLDINVSRSGASIFHHATWTENSSQAQTFIHQQWWVRAGLGVQFDSPVTGLLTDPSGKQVGWNPVTGKPIYNVFGLVSSIGSEPYNLFISAAPSGQYTLQVTGTATGSYTLSAFSLDTNGISSSKDPIQGTTLTGYTDTYYLTYPATAGKALYIQRQVPIAIKPGDTGPTSVAINIGSSGFTPVAILSTPTFDASSVNPDTVRFGPAGTSAVHCAVEDVNGDGLPDMMCHFKTDQADLTDSTTSAMVTGQTTLGVNIVGWGPIWTVPPHGPQRPWANL